MGGTPLWIVVVGCAGTRGQHRDASVGVDASSQDAGTVDAGTDCDQDRDGFLAAECGGDDCDDADPSVHPGALEAGAWIDDPIEGAEQGTLGFGFALERDGVAHVVYSWTDDDWVEGTDFPENELRYATNRAGAWTIERIDPDRPDVVDPRYDPQEGAVMHPNAVAVDAAGAVHAAYEWDYGAVLVAPDGRTERPVQQAWIRYATNATGSWAEETVAEIGDAAGLDRVYPGLGFAVDESGAVHVSYAGGTACEDAWCDWSDLYYATNRTGAWEVEEVDDDDDRVAGGSALALDADGAPAIAYVSGDIIDDFPWPDPELRFAARRGGLFHTEEVAQLDEGWEFPRGGYYLEYCCPDIVADESAPVEFYPQGRFALAYLGGRVGVAEGTPGSWTAHDVAGTPGRTYYEHLSQAIDDDRDLHVSWTKSEIEDGAMSYEVGYAKGHGSSWTSEVVASIDEARTPASALQLAADGTVHLVYRDGSAGLRYARRIGETDGRDQDCDGADTR
jgi:hypothetical protein